MAECFRQRRRCGFESHLNVLFAVIGVRGFFVPLEELVNSSGFHPEEYGFESRTGYQCFRRTKKPPGGVR